MAAFQPPYQYVIDTSALFNLKIHYPERIFPGVWERFNEMCEGRQVIAPREVLREIKRGNDELLSWADNYIENFLEPSEEEATIIQSLFEFYPKDIIAKYSTRPWADPMVIACAKYYRLPIIQEESNDANQYKIPPMAARLGVRCIRLVAFFEDAGWHFPSIRG